MGVRPLDGTGCPGPPFHCAHPGMQAPAASPCRPVARRSGCSPTPFAGAYALRCDATRYPEPAQEAEGSQLALAEAVSPLLIAGAEGRQPLQFVSRELRCQLGHRCGSLRIACLVLMRQHGDLLWHTFPHTSVSPSRRHLRRRPPKASIRATSGQCLISVWAQESLPTAVR